ncbi:MAG TPA: hypothetical protein VGO93_27275 [Candidatus Xenobia bacterium]|jgi:hypothetical protein
MQGIGGASGASPSGGGGSQDGDALSKIKQMGANATDFCTNESQGGGGDGSGS